MNKAYSRINWQNQPSTTTALGATNLNRMDLALNTIDDRVLVIDTTKAEVTAINPLIKSVSYNNSNGVLTFTHQNGTATVIDTAMEKIVTNFSYNPKTKSIDLTLADGTKQSIDISDFITNIDLVNSSTIQFSVDPNGKTKADIINGSIKENHLQPNYLADCQLAKTNAENSANNSKRYAVGGVTAGDAKDNAKYYKEQAEIARDQAELIVGFKIDTEPNPESLNPLANKAVAKQIATAEDSFLSLSTLNGGLRVNSINGKSVEEGTGIKSPDNPYLIKGVGESGSVTLTACGKNMFATTRLPLTSNGLTVSKDSNGNIIINGTPTTTTGSTNFNCGYGAIEKNKTYTMSMKESKIGIGVTCGVVSGTLNITMAESVDKKTYSVVGSTYGSYAINVSNDIGTLTNYVVNPMLEIENSKNAYEPYKETKATITLTTPAYDGDKLEKRNGIWGIPRDKMKAVFDGSSDENWLFVTTTNNDTVRFDWQAAIPNSTNGTINNLSCDKFKVLGNADNSDVEHVRGSSSIANAIVFFVNKSRIHGWNDSLTAVEKQTLFKTWLSSNIITLLYQLATPIWTPLSASEQAQLNALQTFSGQTNIFLDDALNPTLNVSYGKTDVAALALYDENRVNTLNRSDYLYKSNIVNNDAVTQEGFAWDARRGTQARKDIDALNDKVTLLNDDKLTKKDIIVTNATYVSNFTGQAVTVSGLVIINRMFSVSDKMPSNAQLMCTIQSGYRPKNPLMGYASVNGALKIVWIGVDGTITVDFTNTTGDRSVIINLCYAL